MSAEPAVRRRIALVWAQFAAYHVDRCEAVAAHLGPSVEVISVELADGSEAYAWDASGDVRGTRKVTLFPGRTVESISRVQRFFALARVLWRCDVVFFGIGYNEKDIIALSWVLRLFGVRLVMMSDSKFEDRQRSVVFESIKSLVLASYHSAFAAGWRQRSYFRFLGFGKRPILMGYDTVNIERMRSQANLDGPVGEISWRERNFLYVGRFVAKKNLLVLIDAYAAYVALAGDKARKLVMAGAGPEENAIRDKIEQLGISDKVTFSGFLTTSKVSRLMGRSLALLLVSTEEQWGLVVNEALACGLPVVVSRAVGACDLLVRNLINGYIVEPSSIESIAQAMLTLASDEAEWERMANESSRLAPLGDTRRFAEAAGMFLEADTRRIEGVAEQNSRWGLFPGAVH